MKFFTLSSLARGDRTDGIFACAFFVGVACPFSANSSRCLIRSQFLSLPSFNRTNAKDPFSFLPCNVIFKEPDRRPFRIIAVGLLLVSSSDVYVPLSQISTV